MGVVDAGIQCSFDRCYLLPSGRGASTLASGGYVTTKLGCFGSTGPSFVIRDPTSELLEGRPIFQDCTRKHTSRSREEVVAARLDLFKHVHDRAFVTIRSQSLIPFECHCGHN